MSFRLSLFGLLAAAGVLAAGVFAAGPASTAEAASKRCVSNNHGSKVCFQPYGDKMYVKDTAKDGYSAGAVWETSYGRQGTCLNVHGSGVLVDCNYNMKEDERITFWAVNVDNPTDQHVYWSVDREATI